MEKLVIDFLKDLSNGELSSVSAQKKAKGLLEQYGDFPKRPTSKDYVVVRITFADDYENTELLLVNQDDCFKAQRLINGAYKKYYEDNGNHEKYGHVFNFIEEYLEKTADFPYTWIYYEDVNF